MAKGRKTGGGSRKGRLNQTTSDVREAIAKLAEDLGPSLQSWISQVAAEDPARAAEIFLRAIEYHIPKLSRAEVSGKDGGDIPIGLKVEFVRSK